MRGYDSPIARGNYPSLRKLVFVVFGLLTLLFFSVSFFNSTAHAAEASRSGGVITHEGRTYQSMPAGTPVPPGVPPSSYRSIDTASSQVHFLIFPTGSTAVNATSAERAVYGFTPPDTYTPRVSSETVPIATAAGTAADPLDPAAVADPNDTPEDVVPECAGAAVDQVGWIVCPISRHLAKGVDWLYDIVNDFLEVAPPTAGSSIHQLWGVMRAIANVCFVIAFLIIIYSQISNLGISNYGIKRTLPRLIIAAILVNISFWICALAVDISNYLGYVLYDLTENIMESMPIPPAEISWVDATAFVLSAGGIGFLWFTAATAGSLAAAVMLLVSLLIGVTFAVLIAFIILAARQALIVMLIALSPLAFVAYLLPNTEKWFDKWKDAFLTLLIMFPLFSILFGGAQLAGAAIIASAGDKFTVVLIGMATQLVPLAITPLLIRFSGGILSTVARLSNDRGRGLFDRANNWTKNRADYFADKARGNDPKRWWEKANLAQRAAKGLDGSNRRLEHRRKAYQQMAENRAMRHRKYEAADEMVRTAELDKHQIEAGHDKHWKSKFDLNNSHFNKGLFEKEMSTRASNSTSKLLDSRLDKAESEMRAGVNPYLQAGNSGSSSLDFKRIVDEMQRATETEAYTDMAKNLAERAVRENVARNLTEARSGANTTMIDGKALHAYAGGIMKETGEFSALASAKSTASKYLLDDAQNIQNTLEYEVATNNERLHERFKNAKTLAERIAYSNAMGKNGAPGVKMLQKVFEEYEADPTTNLDDLMTYQEVLASNSSIMSAGKNIEFWLTRSQKMVNGKPQVDAKGAPIARTFREISDDPSTFTNLSASAFASQNADVQYHALELLHNKKPDQYMRIINSLRDNPNAMASIKQQVREKFSIYSDTELKNAQKAGRPLDPPGTVH